MQPNNSPLPGDGFNVTLDKPRVMRLNLGAFRRVIKETGQSPFQKEFWDDFGTANLEKVSVVFWASLLHEEPSLTREAADAIADALTFSAVMDAVQSCVAASMPAKKEDAPA